LVTDLNMSVEPIRFPVPTGGFVSPLLRARDWQNRPEFGALCEWWKSGGVGVCALIGIGGAGKTAIAERFLQVLPGGYPEHPRVPKDLDLPGPKRLLVFSFYDAPNPDKFFSTLAVWLEGRPPDSSTDDSADRLPRTSSYQKTRDLLAAAEKCLLVLDGLEKAQDDGSRGGAFGHIRDGRLRDLVLRVADGWLPQVSLIITSRFRLFDPLASRAWYHRQIGVERLQPSAAVQLLRDRNVRGPYDELEHIAREQGFHALSVDLAGGYIARFCGGDPKRLSSLAQETEDVEDSILDPQIAAIREQERRFGRLAERYHQALAHSDPATLALLQRICLFRLGVDAKTLASIFIGQGKESISGFYLASLSEKELGAKLQLLVEMRLIEVSQFQAPASKSLVYTVHPAVRDGFLRKLDAESARLGHEAVRVGLEASLGGQPGDDPSDPATLDLMEEIIFHTLSAGFVEEAWDVYWSRTGHYTNLGRRLGVPQQGRRLCSYFLTEDKEAKIVGIIQQSWLFNNLGLFCRDLGALGEALQFYEKSVELRRRSGAAIALGIRNISHICLQMGCLRAAWLHAQAALDERGSIDDKILGLALAAQARFLMGDATLGARELEGKHNRSWPTDGSGQPMFYPELWKSLAMHRIGRKDHAKTRMFDLLLATRLHGRTLDEMRSSLALADFSIEENNLSEAQMLLDSAHQWALNSGVNDLLCWSSVVRAKTILAAFNNQQISNQVDRESSFVRAFSVLEDGLRIARDCGYGVHHIDLLLVRAQLSLHEGRANNAERDVRVALDEGIHPPAESGFPDLLAATAPECFYAWGIAEGRHLLAESLLLQTAQKLGQANFTPKEFNNLPDEIRGLIGQAREQLDQALDFWRKLRDPESEDDINPHGKRTRRAIERLEGGVLTEYPIVEERSAEPESAPQESTISNPSTASVFICYAHADNQSPKNWLDRLMVHLAPLVRQEDITVWSDQRLKIGDEWDPEIQQQLDLAKVAVLLVSPAFLASRYIADSELPVLLKRARQDGLKILPIFLSPSSVHKVRFKWPDPRNGPEEFTLDSLQAAGSPSETLSEMTEPQQDRIFVALAERILEILDTEA
jgi:tetratricopeptide (TPR) repeat protein